jgi:hypothetical protein
VETTLLHELSLLYIDSLDFKDNCYSVYIKADNGPKEFLIVLNNILSFNYSVDSLDDEADHSFNVLDVFHEYRKPYNSDLKSHEFWLYRTCYVKPRWKILGSLQQASLS